MRFNKNTPSEMIRMKMKNLKDAIKSRCPISFEYNKEGKSSGLRTGDPHAIYINRAKNGEESTKVHIVLTGGISDSQKEFPSWRTFDFEMISNITLLVDAEKFEISPSYNPLWDGYNSVIAKI